ncbi:hypothetical protein AK830_g2725 [Neonectria ditissima]|uniref:Uncharacterized protein n=1 Tax=Neonectria ditissima TaxID=78410 RepID=A0A0N8H877_9HYPO|nr:hypothetical protein AK830_g2725 [Neonectria ditissima]
MVPSSTSSSRRAARFQAHWVTPTLMVSSVLFGTLLAVGHHLFYASLDGQIVTSSEQQVWNLRIGTGLAFLVKACLTAAAGLAYTQLLWYTLRSQEISLNGIDAVFSVVNNIYGFATGEIWIRSPALVLIASIMWLLPLVAIVTPSSLTVQQAPQLNESTIRMPLPVIDYTSPTVFAEWAQSGGSGYAAPSNAMARLMAAVVSQGSITHIPAPFSNCSYSVKFYGPSLSCGPVDKDSALAKRLNASDINAGSRLSYVAFVPKATGLEDGESVEQVNAIYGLNSTINTTLTAGMRSLDKTDAGDHAKLFLGLPNSNAAVDSNTIIDCGLYNSSYVVDFSFKNDQQQITVRNSTRLNGVLANQQSFNSPLDVPGVAYTSILDALGGLLVGTLRASQYGYVTAFNTHITSTILMQTQEMQRIAVATRWSDSEPSEEQTLANMTMSEAVEQLVTNTTLSLFSNSFFLQNSTTASMGDVKIRTPQNAFSYKPRNLVIAYGVSVFITIVVVMVGFACIWVSSLSFGSSFSTILRTTRNPELDALLCDDGNSGAEPLPRHLAKRKLAFQRHSCEQETKTGGVFTVVRNRELEELKSPQGPPSYDGMPQGNFF